MGATQTANTRLGDERVKLAGELDQRAEKTTPRLGGSLARNGRGKRDGGTRDSTVRLAGGMGDCQQSRAELGRARQDRAGQGQTRLGQQGLRIRFSQVGVEVF